MPMYTPSSDIPRDLVEAAEDVDDTIGAELEAIIPPPSSPYNAKTLTALAKALASLGKVMGIDIEAETYSEPSTRLDPDMVRFLAMFEQAAEDYGQPLPVALDQIKGDRELTAITAHLMKLAQDSGFSDFLDSPMDEAEVKIEIRGDGEEMEEEEEFDFASRMRR